MRLAIVLVLALTLLGCAGAPRDPTADWSAQRFYTEAKSALDEGDYEAAIGHYEKLEARFPYGPYARQAQLEIAYAYYKYDEPESAIAAADRFIKLHPRHSNVDYAYYLKGLVNFNRGENFIDRWLPRDDSRRDIGPAREAFRDFGALLSKFPNSRYAQDARAKMLYLKGVMAAHEIHVARFYFDRGAFVAAVNRAKHVIERYPQSASVADALAVMARAYRAMGLEALRRDTVRVIALNYPNHPLVSQTRTAQQSE
ncbi:MAG: outer membrane protein assembly factor BamD [Gammaproteobacteria bacterium]|nr:outer membrane protein assembly factor BamD [Gammaproteobacteria bacterium]